MESTGSPTPPSASPPRRHRVVFLVLSAVLTLALAEVGAALVFYLRLDRTLREQVEVAIGSGSTWDPGSPARYRSHPFLNYVGNPEFRFPDGTRLFNEHGFRETGADWRRKSEGGLRLVVLGGSTTFGWLFESAEATWPNVLAARLSAETGREVEVVNGGLPAYSSYNLVVFSTLWLPELDADVVVVHAGFNDAFSAAYPDEGGPAGTMVHRSFAHRPVPQPWRALLRGSHLARLLGVDWLRRNNYLGGALVRATMQPIPSKGDVVGRGAAADGRLFRRNLGTLVERIRAAGAVPVISNIPISPDVGKQTNESVSFVAARRNNEIAKAVAAEQSVAFVDLYAAMREPAGYVDPVHLNETGMRIKADALFPVVRQALADP